MARDHATVNMGIWQDPDFRALPPAAQHLYFVLWTSPGLSYCGVLDWRPGRLAASAAGWSREDVERAARCLVARHFLVVDEVTEECLIRSWVRWDGLMKQPRVAVSYANAYATVASNTLRTVIIHELKKMRQQEPELAGLARPQVVAMLDLPAVSAKDLPTVTDPFGPGLTPNVGGGFGDGLGDEFAPSLGETLPNVWGSVSVPPTPSPSPAPTPSPERDAALPHGQHQPKGERLPPNWQPSGDLFAAMAIERPEIDLEAEHAKFTDYWTAKSGKDATKRDWSATWRLWIRNARPGPAANGSPVSRRQADTDAQFQRMLDRARERDAAKAAGEQPKAIGS